MKTLLKTGQKNLVGHPLNRPMFIPVRTNSASVIHDSSGANARPSKQFIVSCTVDVTVTWVFLMLDKNHIASVFFSLDQRLLMGLPVLEPGIYV